MKISTLSIYIFDELSSENLELVVYHDINVIKYPVYK